ncbi:MULTISPECIES: F0F1 ATP synthase subunit A [Helicobacter]|uniref:ATP synthase subunit a n=1 Tax=Helicobacter colisuis TaxID=2949739 RepID=A0ABT0TVQ0_9HELI|nr:MULTISPECIES: F0F1 ATP synthase subunit A [Helicobacter]MCI2235298.1 F0F1 ATP synthase subunit A [Helicobacter sp. CaF467b]MCI7047270.1 F0F1 ATP synthase subunit A [Helicobacter sp.]MCI7764976.1 F0F1 ATP synthase subunit A [Helicobacter sp.]MCL9819869.1 F0F1 ATP synthase subunit A [Helicobacter colisuis]MCL9821113.1 F0F1 ATP synthase subunit A [Helicobacter colisuis]
MNSIFTFAGLINHNHDFIIAFHVVLVAIIAVILAKLATSRMQVVPGTIQNVFEAFLGGVIFMAKDVIGEEKARQYLPLTATLALFVFLANAIGIIPGFEAPSSSLSFTLTLALVVFVYYNFEGIRTFGIIKYFAHFAGPVKALAPLMFPIEIISHCSRVVSLSFRLFGNIKGDDMFLLVMLMLAPWVAPLPAFLILTFMAFLQAFIFMILTYVFLAGAVLASEEAH